MPGIYGMAILTILVTSILCITTLNHLMRSSRQTYWLVLAGLPLSLIVNRLIKVPVITGIATWTGIPLKLGLEAPLWFIIAIWLAAPIFEEAIKVLPMVIPASRAFLHNSSQALWAGLALGFGFGLGEAAYLAHGIAQSPAYHTIPWYMFTGFASERLIVTLGHGLLTAAAVLGLYYGRKRALLGYLMAVGLHALINLGPILLALKLIPGTVSSMVSYAAILGAFVIFQKNERTAKKMNGIAPQEIIYFER
jgi:uncharacterized membrane protein YhfC